jgi:hypothetical protein
LQARAVCLVAEELVGGDLDEDEDGGRVAVADLGGQADAREGLNELDEAGFGFGSFYMRSRSLSAWGLWMGDETEGDRDHLPSGGTL